MASAGSATVHNLEEAPLMPAMLDLKGYAPGSVTAVTRSFPFSIHLLNRVVGERWVNKNTLVSAIIFGSLLRTPGFSALIYLAGKITIG
jgi:hypothetical protein